ncbi:Zinc finger protein 862 [Frankliniella fusca]|uniref:Zinc finger protein 862 n=1 Tax=Frankliniella fusca TaxID=407009 RepID=A0AAE1GVV0_9NEOP|nr:Zinc finger protein 862 [Frankliniella fusca]
MGKWAKYSKKYNQKWELDPLFKGWLQRTPEHLINEGKSEAYCHLCKTCIRPHKSDLIAHKDCATHRRNEKALPGRAQPQLEHFGYEGGATKSTQQKTTDIKICMMVACHTSIKSVDHISEMMRSLGTGGPLEDLRLHRTKCTKVIEKVIAPSLLVELIEDLGDRFYSLIVDESTDHSTKKLLALCIKHYSPKEGKMLVQYLGIIETPQATAEKLYEATTKFLRDLGLDVRKLLALGTDGGLNLCGRHNSLYALLKSRDCPHLMLVKCTCHSLDKCASYASKNLPDSLEYLIRETRNWFCHSALRKHQYGEIYRAMCGTEPPLLVKLAATRWLSFYGAVKTHLDQFVPLQTLFKKISESNGNPDKCQTAVMLTKLHNDEHLLYLTFLKPVLEHLTRINLLFQRTETDMTRAFTDLRVYVFGVAARVLRNEALLESAQQGMLRRTELEALRAALSKKDSLRPLDQVKYGDGFVTMSLAMERSGALSSEKIREIKACCANFLTTLSKELAERLPDCIHDVENLRHLAPTRVLAARGRPEFGTLPFHLIPHGFDRDTLETQWTELGVTKIEDICPDASETLGTIDTVKFWKLCYEVKNGAGQQPLKELATCALTLLSLPLSNAVVERVFSIMNIVKSKLRNRMSISVLNAILFLRLYLKAHDICCLTYQPTKDMLQRFNARNMYPPARPRHPGGGAPGNAGEPEREGDRLGEEAVDDVLEGAVGGQEEAYGQDVIHFEDDAEAIDAVLDILDNQDLQNIFI